MNNTVSENAGPTENPYQDLYIYYLEGHLSRANRRFGNHFIGNWEEDEFTFLFYSKPSDDSIKMMIADQPQMKLLDQFYMTYDQWHGGEVEALSAGKFLIKPPWEINKESPCQKTGTRLILLDPGVVFGTGTHPTTKDCLSAIDMAFEENIPKRGIDIGTGTGILALAAASAGCPQILAVDLNLLSAQTTQKNIILNGLEEKVLAVQGSAEKFMDYPVDFMIANIHYDIMKNLLDSEGFYRNKRFVLSGLLRSEAKAVKDRLYHNGAQIIQTWDQNGIWFTFLGITN